MSEQSDLQNNPARSIRSRSSEAAICNFRISLSFARAADPSLVDKLSSMSTRERSLYIQAVLSRAHAMESLATATSAEVKTAVVPTKVSPPVQSDAVLPAGFLEQVLNPFPH